MIRAMIVLLASVASAAAQAPASPKDGDCWAAGNPNVTACQLPGGAIQYRAGPVPPGTMMSSEANWHLFTLSRCGTVSLLHGLTKDACEKARTLALDIFSIDARGNFTSRTVHVTSGTIIRAECFQ